MLCLIILLYCDFVTSWLQLCFKNMLWDYERLHRDSPSSTVREVIRKRYWNSLLPRRFILWRTVLYFLFHKTNNIHHMLKIYKILLN